MSQRNETQLQTSGRLELGFGCGDAQVVDRDPVVHGRGEPKHIDTIVMPQAYK